MNTENRLQHMPISFFAMVMGLAGLSIGWEKASKVYHFSSMIYSTILILALIISIAQVLYNLAPFRNLLLPFKTLKAMQLHAICTS